MSRDLAPPRPGGHGAFLASIVVWLIGTAVLVHFTVDQWSSTR